MTVRTEVVGAAAIVTMAWTAKRNALGPPEAEELTGALREAGDQAPKALILTGEGAFSAGGDLAAVAELGRTRPREEVRDSVYGRFQGVVRALRDCPVPTIAAIDGAAVGFGLDLALACDTRIVGPSGWVQQGWARVGLLAGTGGIALAERIRTGLIWDLLDAEGRLGPADCARLGIAEPSDEPAREAALRRAGSLARYERDVLGHYAALARATSWPPDEHFAEVADIQSELLGSDRFLTLANSILGRT